MKLELKHIVGYLPYETSVVCIGSFSTPKPIHKLNYGKGLGNINHILTSSRYKIALRPLSDLTKVIEVNGEEFVPIIALAKLFFSAKSAVLEYKDILDAGAYGIQVSCFYDEHRHAYYQIYGDIDLISHNEHRVIEKLYEWHFDIHGLIEKGLAIDKNTIV